MQDLDMEILTEIANDRLAISKSLSILDEADEQPVKAEGSKKSVFKEKLIKKGKDILSNMQRKVSDEDYLTNGFSYHSKILYSMSVKYPLLARTIGVPLIAIAKTATDNVISKKIEQDKIMNVYTGYKSSLAGIEAKLEQLEKLQKPSNVQKEEIITLKKMATELEVNIKRLEDNLEISKEGKSSSGKEKRRDDNESSSMSFSSRYTV